MLGRLLKRDWPLDSGGGSNETTGTNIYDWAQMFAPGNKVVYGGNAYQAFTNRSPGADAYGTNPIVFSVAAIRLQLFSEARFQFQQLRNGKPGDLFGTQDLGMLETPWPGHTTRDLLTQAELDIMGSGNSYWVNNGGYFLRLDGGKTSIVTTSAHEFELGGQVVGETLSYYLYKPDSDPRHWTVYTPDQVCHYMPYPDPQNRFAGMSWLSPCLPDVNIDDTISGYKQATITNGATLNTVVSFDPSVNDEQFEFFVKNFRAQHDGPQNSAKTLFLGGGADVKTVSQSFQDLMLTATQSATEVRICAVAGVPPAIVGVSDALRGSSLNAGNYGEARRRLSDVTMRPLWGAFAGSMESLIKVPNNARLWYDDQHIAFMREDQADAASILDNNASALLKLIQMGFDPDASVDAITNGDLSRLAGQHSGLYSVQLQPPGNGLFPEGQAPAELVEQPALPGLTPAAALPASQAPVS